MTSTLISSLELSQRLILNHERKTLVLSNRQMDWNGILVEQYQVLSTSGESVLPALSDHWLTLSIGPSSHLLQKSDDRRHESIFQKGDSILVPAGQATSWQRREGPCCALFIYLKPELIGQTAEASEIDPYRFTLMNCYGQQDLQLYQIGMLLLAEMQSGGIMGRLYAESLTQALIIHLLRSYSTVTRIITAGNRSLTRTQLRQAIDYIQTHLNRDLSLAELASVTNISPTYFASLFKQAMGISPHQYVIQQRVEQAKLMLSKTDLAIRATHRLRQRRYCLTSRLLQSEPFNPTVQAHYWNDPKTDSLTP
ncbi:MAG: AraC family transcriptional regulator [Cyanosarcina radialis HA8281-LM2]|jgi:AraC family transcriptional regulator|nr:AraC family transcriptional regulator [Cyanosarcina radialis HA8281-LM2]